MSLESPEGRHQLQFNLYDLVKWAAQWQMLFNNDKYKGLHIGQVNSGGDYMMIKTVLPSTKMEKVSVIIISARTMWYCSKTLGLISDGTCTAHKDKRPITAHYCTNSYTSSLILHTGLEAPHDKIYR